MLYAVLDESTSGRALLGVFGILVLMLIVWVIDGSPALNWIAWVPVTPPARVLVMLEQFAGVAHIALVVSRLIGMTLVRQQEKESS